MEESKENTEIFFTKYTRHLSKSISKIPNPELKSDIQTLFSQVQPVLKETIKQKQSKQKSLKLKRIIKELRNIESLLDIINNQREQEEPLIDNSKGNKKILEKASRIDDTKETYYYKTKDPIDTNLLLTVHKEYEEDKKRTGIPPWDPKSAIGKPSTRPPYEVSIIHGPRVNNTYIIRYRGHLTQHQPLCQTDQIGIQLTG